MAAMRGRPAIIALAVLAVVIAFAARGGGGDHGGSAGTTTARRPDPGANAAPAGPRLRVGFVYSPEKAALLAPLVARYNAERHHSGGATVQIDGRVVASGEAADDIAAQRLKPALWSPASSLWGQLLNYSADRLYAPRQNPSLVRTPLVIAMWEPMARALGWPRQRVGFGEILRLATSRRGWAAVGHPELGPFKLGHTNPDFSTSGLSAVAAEYFAQAGKREGLSTRDVESPAVRARIRRIERSIVHYGDTTLFFEDQLLRYGTAYASAVAMEEVTLLDFNRRRRTGPRLVALYPREGTFYSDNPLIVLDASWVPRPQATAARAFLRWLRSEVTPAIAARFRFRSGDPRAAAPAPIDRANGADPRQPTRVLALPAPQVLDRIRRAWREDRKPANVMLVVDTSGSMTEEDRLPQAKRGLRDFLALLSPADRVGLVRFSSSVHEVAPIAPVRRARPALLRRIRRLVADGDTALYDATNSAVRAVRALGDRSRINAVVLLTDGNDTASRLKDEDVIAPLKAQSASEGITVRVFTIAYGSNANDVVLKDIADASGGKPFAGDPDEIQTVYRTIASFF
jgi:Ca-activated chloride channel family protein